MDEINTSMNIPQKAQPEEELVYNAPEKKPAQILTDETEFAKFLKSPRFNSFMAQAYALLEDNTFLYDERVKAPGSRTEVPKLFNPGQSNAEDGDAQENDGEAANEQVDSVETEIARSIGDIANVALTRAFGKDEEEKDNADADAEATEEEKNDAFEIAKPFVAALTKSLIRVGTASLNTNRAEIATKLGPVIKNLGPFFAKMKPGMDFLAKTDVAHALAPLDEAMKGFGIDVGQIKEDLTPLYQTMCITSMMGGKDMVAQAQYAFNNKSVNLIDLDARWKNTPMEDRVPKNSSSKKQEAVFRRLDEANPDDMGKVDCLNQMVVNLRILQEPMEIKGRTPEFVKSQFDLRHQAFKNLNYLYFRYNSLLEHEHFNQNEATMEYNEKNFRLTQNGKDLCFVVGKFLQEGFTYTDSTAINEEYDFKRAEKKYNELLSNYLNEKNKLFENLKDRRLTFKLGENLMKQTSDKSYNAPDKEVEWNTPDHKRPKNLEAFGDKWEIGLIEMVYHPELFVDDEIVVDDPAAPDGKKTVTVPCGMTVLENQIQANIDHENAMFSGIKEYTKEQLTKERDTKIEAAQLQHNKTIELCGDERTQLKEKLEKANVGVDYSEMKEQKEFDSQVKAFRTSLKQLGDSDAKKELQNFLAPQANGSDFFETNFLTYFEKKQADIGKIIESQNTKVSALKAQIQEKENRIKTLNDTLNETAIRNKALNDRINTAENDISVLKNFLETHKNDRGTYDFTKAPDDVLKIAGLDDLKPSLNRLYENTQGIPLKFYSDMTKSMMFQTASKFEKASSATVNMAVAIRNLKAAMGSKIANDAFSKAPFNILDSLDSSHLPDHPVEDLKNPDTMMNYARTMAANHKLVSDFRTAYQQADEAGLLDNYFPEGSEAALRNLLECANNYSAPTADYLVPVTNWEMNETGIEVNTKNAFKTIETKISELSAQVEQWDDEINENTRQNTIRATSSEYINTSKELKQTEADKAKLEADLAGRSAELKCMNDAKDLMRQGTDLVKLKLQDEHFKDKQRYAALGEQIKTAQNHNEQVREQFTKEYASKLEDKYIEECIKEPTAKHNAKIQELTAAKAEFGKMKEKLKDFQKAAQSFSKAGVRLGKATKALQDKIAGVRINARDNRPDRDVIKDFDDRQDAIMQDVMASGKTFGRNSKEFENIKSAIEAYKLKDIYGSTTKQYVVLNAKKWEEGTRDLMTAITDYLAIRDKEKGKTKWTQKGQERLDAVKRLKQIIESRALMLDAEKQDMEKIDKTKTHVNVNNMDEVLMQLAMEKNKANPVTGLLHARNILNGNAPGYQTAESFGVGEDFSYSPKKNIVGKIKQPAPEQDKQPVRNPPEPEKEKGGAVLGGLQ